MSDWCKHHPKYEAKRKPGSVCGRCWELWFLRNPELKPGNPELAGLKVSLPR